MRLVLDHYPVKSVRSIGWLPGAAFRRTFIPLGPDGRHVSLDVVEHRILRPDLPAPVAVAVAQREPRVRFLDYDWSLNGR